MKVLMTDAHLGDSFVEQLQAEFPQVEFITAMNIEEQFREAPDADVICGWPDSPDVVEAASRLRWIHCPGTGIDKIMAEMPTLADSDVVLTNARGPHANPMGRSCALDDALSVPQGERDGGRPAFEQMGGRKVFTRVRGAFGEHNGHPCIG